MTIAYQSSLPQVPISKLNALPTILPSSQPIKKESSWRDHCVSYVSFPLHAFLHGMRVASQNTLEVVSALLDDTNQLANVFRKLDKFVIAFFQQISSASRSFGAFRETIKTSVASIDAFQICSDLSYFATGHFKKAGEHMLHVAGKISFFVANTLGFLLWIKDMSFINLDRIVVRLGDMKVFSFVPNVVASVPLMRDSARLNQIARTIGELRVFGFITKVPLGTIAGRAADLGLVCMAGNAVRKLIQDDFTDPEQTIERDPQWRAAARKKAMVDLGACSAELAVDLMMIAGVTSVVSLGILASVCIVATVASAAAGVHLRHVREARELEAEKLIQEAIRLKKLEAHQMAARK